VKDHWKPYFQFAFFSGLRQGEQIALKRKDIDWDSNVIHIRRAVTLDENGKKMMGKTKNTYSRRTLDILPMMREALLTQEKRSKMLKSKFLFCTPKGKPVDPDNLRGRVWAKALKTADIPYRPMIQTRHSFATTAFSLGENPLWIAKVMGHRDTDMIIKVYAKYVENINGTTDGNAMNSAFHDAMGRK
jgi:integrase